MFGFVFSFFVRRRFVTLPTWLTCIHPESLRTHNPKNCFSSYQEATLETFLSVHCTDCKYNTAYQFGGDIQYDNYEACNELSIKAVCDNRHLSYNRRKKLSQSRKENLSIEMSFYSKQQIFRADFRNDCEESGFIFFHLVFRVMHYSSLLLMTFPLEQRPFKK